MASNKTVPISEPSIDLDSMCLLYPVPPLIPGISDINLSLIAPLVSFWAGCLLFYVLDETGWCSRYRLHTSKEESSRNTVTKRRCLEVVLFNQAMQTLVGYLLSLLGDGDFSYSHECGVASWIDRLHHIRQALYAITAVTGINIPGVLHKVTAVSTSLGWHPLTLSAMVELWLAKTMYWVVVPAFQLAVCCFVTDTWQYFTHRWLHMNTWGYKNIHYIHHQLYVPYHYGAGYTHPLENIALDTVSAVLSLAISGMSTRLAICYYFWLSFNAVLLHSGYQFPPTIFHSLSDNDVYFHDIHHQHWGLKYNFGVTLTLWDRLLGTYWSDTEAASRLYEKGRLAAERRSEKQVATVENTHKTPMIK